MVSKRVFYLPELIVFLIIRNHQVMHEIPPGDAERHLWLRAWMSKVTANNAMFQIPLFLSVLKAAVLGGLLLQIPWTLYTCVLCVYLVCTAGAACLGGYFYL